MQKLPANRHFFALRDTLLCWPSGCRKRVGRRVKDQIERSTENLWSEISGRLREALNDGTYTKWFGDVRGLELEGESLILTVPDELSRDWIHRHFRGLLNAAVRDITGASL